MIGDAFMYVLQHNQHFEFSNFCPRRAERERALSFVRKGGCVERGANKEAPTPGGDTTKIWIAYV